jgi:hypothetical protein
MEDTEASEARLMRSARKMARKSCPLGDDLTMLSVKRI